MDTMPTYDDDDSTEDSTEVDYDYIYNVNSNKLPSLVELYDFCIEPSVCDTFWYFVPLFLVTFGCNFAARLSQYKPLIFEFSPVNIS